MHKICDGCHRSIGESGCLKKVYNGNYVIDWLCRDCRDELKWSRKNPIEIDMEQFRKTKFDL